MSTYNQMDWGKAFMQILEIENALLGRIREPLAKSSQFADEDIEAKNEKSLGQVQNQD